MKKVIIAFDGKRFSEAAFDFIRRLNEKQPVLATAVFLPGVDYAELLYSLGGFSGPLYFESIEAGDTDIVQVNMQRFKQLCQQNNIDCRIHSELDKHVIAELKEESRYADLMVISSELFYKNLGEDKQDEYIERTLHNAECPVILIPEHYHFPENTILAYDGSASSVYAIKQFAYLLPEFTGLKTLLVYAGAETKELPGKIYIEELLNRHFSDLRIIRLEMEPQKYFNSWLEENGNAILVSGAYGRSGLSEMIKKSFITDVIHDHKLPVFITHR